MKTKRLLLSLSCLLLFAVTSHAQPEGPQFDFTQEFVRLANKNKARSEWNGSLEGIIGQIVNSEIREAWNITDEQHQQIEEIARGQKIPLEYRESPEGRKIVEDMEIQMNILRMQNADRETRERKLLEFEEQIMRGVQDSRDRTLDSLLTAEQKRKIKEFEIVMMSSPIMNHSMAPHMFEALDLTDVQKQQVETIKKELEPEFALCLESRANGVYDLTREKALAMQFRIKMFDVLTDEQWLRIQDLVDNPPEYIKVFLKKVKANIEKNAGNTGWQPGVGSWQPGDAIPEAYRQERNARGNFPRP